MERFIRNARRPMQLGRAAISHNATYLFAKRKSNKKEAQEQTTDLDKLDARIAELQKRIEHIKRMIKKSSTKNSKIKDSEKS